VPYITSSNTQSTHRPGFLAICILVGVVAWAYPQTSAAPQKGSAMPTRATGTFEVKLTPQKDEGGDPSLGRMTIDKQFHGELEGTSKGQMLSAGSAEGSGVYVAVEKVTGTLNGRTGTFILHHTGLMTRKVPQLSINVAPDSGTGQLAGITGKMNIIITNGKHSYEFDYTLPESQ
jgi:hypothetical protein